MSGTGVTKDEAEAFRYYTLAAEQGHDEAQYCLGGGTGKLENELNAVKHYKLAADQGDACAQYKLGLNEWLMFKNCLSLLCYSFIF